MGNRQNRLVVLGAPRSGTTLLRRLLNAHPEIASPPETYLFSAAARFLHCESIVGGGRLGVIAGLAHAGFSPDDVRANLRGFIFSYLEDYANREGKSRWAEKTAVDVFHLDRIEELCEEEVTYICIVRHGLDVACSMRDLSDKGEAYLSELHWYIQKYPRPLEAFCHAWVDSAQAIESLRQRRPEQTVTIRYEDLIENPDQEMSRISDFVGTEWDEKLIQQALGRIDDVGLGDWRSYQNRKIKKSSVSRWKNLSQKTRSELGCIVNATLESWDYDPVPIMRDQHPDEELRRFRVALKLHASKQEDADEN